MAYRTHIMTKTEMKGVEYYIGETIEEKVERIMSNKEPIRDGAPLQYTERKDGVNPDHDIRTDRWEHAIDATDAMTKSRLAKRESRGKIVEMPKEEPKDTGKKEGEA